MSDHVGNFQISLSAEPATTGKGGPTATFIPSAIGPQSYSTPESAVKSTIISITQGADRRLLVCINGQQTQLRQATGFDPTLASQPDGWFDLPFLSGWAPLGGAVNGIRADKGLVLGDPYGASASMQIEGLWVMMQRGAAWDCETIETTYRASPGGSPGPSEVAAPPQSYVNSAPTLAREPQMSPPFGQDAFLSDAVSLSAIVSDPDGDPIRCWVWSFAVWGIPQPELSTNRMPPISSQGSHNSVWCARPLRGMRQGGMWLLHGDIRVQCGIFRPPESCPKLRQGWKVWPVVHIHIHTSSLC